VSIDPLRAFNGIIRRLTIDGSPAGPLVGTTFVAKDLYDVRGHPTGAGNPDWERMHAVPARTASAIERLLGAGATLVGKSCSDELAFSLDGINIHYGTPLNPRFPDRLPGGSSSGRSRRWRPGWWTSPSAPTPAARSACRRATAACTASGPRTGRSRLAHGQWIRTTNPHLADNIRASFEASSRVTVAERCRALAERERLRGMLLPHLGSDTVLCLPTAWTIAPLKRASAEDLATNRKKDLTLGSVAGLLGAPQVSIPIVTESYAIGLSLIAAPGGDLPLLALGELRAARAASSVT
jgi:Asp-tRNA(Asn)/Glu-tRNA(Gln) amidotransferase A subunit family amidase